MKRSAKTILAVFLFICAIILPLCAQSNNVERPEDDEVIIVSRVIVTPAIDTAFYQKYSYFKISIMKWGSSAANATKDPLSPLLYIDLGPVKIKKDSKDATIKNYKFGRIGDIAWVKIKIPSSREIYVSGFTVQIADADYLYFNLPVNGCISIPPKTNYVYLGTMSYSITDEYFSIDMGKSGVRDQFDEAVQLIKKRYGDNTRLERVQLKPFSSTDSN